MFSDGTKNAIATTFQIVAIVYFSHMIYKMRKEWKEEKGKKTVVIEE